MRIAIAMKKPLHVVQQSTEPEVRQRVLRAPERRSAIRPGCFAHDLRVCGGRSACLFEIARPEAGSCGLVPMADDRTG